MADVRDEVEGEEEDREAIAEQLKPRLQEACARFGGAGDPKLILELLDKHADPNCPEVDDKYLAACRANDTAFVAALLDRDAKPSLEDDRKWTPLIWAACHGNLALTRKLLDLGAAELYVDEPQQGEKKPEDRKHTPLHWAAFKGHLHVLWLLLGHELSPHEKDQIGNTVLHQAAAGGHLDVVECLLAQGVDVYAKNNRGHTPIVLCTVSEVCELLKKAMEAKACMDTGRQFSSQVMRYLCSYSQSFFCETAVTRCFVYDTPESEQKEKPVTYSHAVRQRLSELEHQLSHAMHLNRLDAISEALDAAKDQPVDVRLVAKCRQVQQKLESEIQLNQAMLVPDISTLDEFSQAIETLSKAVDDAIQRGADAALVARAKTLRRRLTAEFALTKAMELQPSKTSDAHLRMLEELCEGARSKNASEALLTRATKLIHKLHSEKQVSQRSTECQVVCGKTCVKELEGDTSLPEWAHDPEQFSVFHSEYKSVTDKAEGHDIAPDLLEKAKTQLAALETLLIELKHSEAENALKAAKKKKGKKK